MFMTRPADTRTAKELRPLIRHEGELKLVSELGVVTKRVGNRGAKDTPLIDNL